VNATTAMPAVAGSFFEGCKTSGPVICGSSIPKGSRPASFPVRSQRHALHPSPGRIRTRPAPARSPAGGTCGRQPTEFLSFPTRVSHVESAPSPVPLAACLL
jgi:hypothetical protein